jgi:hypothetical protein
MRAPSQRLHIRNERKTSSSTVNSEMPLHGRSRVIILLHILHENSRSPLCTLWCMFRLERWVNRFLHTSQENGLPALCTLRCLINSARWVNSFLHTSHKNDRSPDESLGQSVERTVPYTFRTKMVVLHRELWGAWLWQSSVRTFCYMFYTKRVVLHCALWDASLGQSAVQTPHEMGRFPVCTLIWVSRLERLVKLLVHTLHEKDRSPPLYCRIALWLTLKNLTHISQ